MKTAGRGNLNHWVTARHNRAHGAADQNSSRSFNWAAKQEKFQPWETSFFLTSPYRTNRELTDLGKLGARREECSIGRFVRILRLARCVLREELTEPSPVTRLHLHELDSHPLPGPTIAHNGAGADFACFQIEEQLDSSA
jgi:hypothetical protein